MISSQSVSSSEVPLRRSADSHEIRALTGVRGVAAFWVVLYHFFPFWVQLVPALAIIELPSSRGHLGVHLFFILSGFILSYVYASGDLKFGFREYGKFIWYRIARIFPNHWVTLCFLVMIESLSLVFHLPINRHGPYSHLIFQATLTQIWPFVPPHQALEWVGPAWTLSAEWFAYIFMFPLLAYVHRRKWSPMVTIVMSCSLLFWVFALFPILTELHVSELLIMAACEFLAGGFIFSTYLHSPCLTALCRKYASAGALLLAGLVIFANAPSPIVENLAVFCMPFLLVGLTSETSWVGWLMSTPPVLWSGRISYAIYITHVVTMHVLKVILPWPHFTHSSFPVRFSVVLANIALILIFAALLHYLVEIPARNYLRKKRPW